MKRASETHHELQTRRQRYERAIESVIISERESMDRYDRYLELKKIWGPGTVLCYQFREPESLISKCWRVLMRERTPLEQALMTHCYDLGQLSSREQKRFGPRGRMFQYRQNVTCIPFHGVFNKYEVDDIFVPVLITPERFRELFHCGWDHRGYVWSLHNGPPPPASQYGTHYAVFL